MDLKSRLFTIICECCGAKIEVDADTRSIFSVEGKNKKKRTFEEVVKDVTSVGARAEEKFKSNIEKEKTKQERLDKLFEDAKKKAEADKDKKPRSIYDFD
ncbi:MAG: hypothetical protein L0Z55_09690 [Planctomycetes bacterium]|nr:hypothetical protein [Planctomycetota bacterium]